MISDERSEDFGDFSENLIINTHNTQNTDRSRGSAAINVSERMMTEKMIKVLGSQGLRKMKEFCCVW